MIKIGIVGNGVVGQAIARSYLEYAEEVRCFDIDPKRRTHSLDDVIACDIIFVCLPSPQNADKSGCDLSIIEEFFAPFAGSEANFVLKSTVPIGTTRRLADDYKLINLVHSPEFLTARCAMVDAQIPARNVIGMSNPYRRLVEEVMTEPGEPTLTINYPTQIGYRALLRLYNERFPGVKTFAMSSDESEALKLIQNSFFATKVAFFNEVHTLCKRLGLDWNNIHETLLADGRIHPAHTQVPGPDGKYGFGGMCLPKDLASLISCMHEAELQAPVMTGAQSRNQLIDRKE